MLKKILGVIGILWGTGMFVSFFARRANVSGAYGAGQVVGLLFGVVFIVAGIRAITAKQ